MVNYLLDDFNDNVIDPQRVDTDGHPAIVETGGKLVTPLGPGSGDFRIVWSTAEYDLTKGRLCVRLSKTGSVHIDVYTYFGIWDNAGRSYTFFGKTNDAQMQAGVQDVGTSVVNTNNDTTVGLGPSWVANTYLGVSYVESTRTLTFAKSTNLTTWTTIRTVVVTGPTFKFRRAGLIFGGANWATGSSNMVMSWDDLTYVATDAALRVKLRYNNAWVAATPKVRVNGTWKTPITRGRFSGGWFRPTS